MADGALKSEFEHYLANKAEFLKRYLGRFIALKDGQVIGAFDDRVEAVRQVSKTHPLGSFLVQHVTESDEQVRFHSRHALPRLS